MKDPLTGASGFTLAPPILMLVTDRRLAGGEGALLRAVAAAVEGGVNAVQMREKDLPPTELSWLVRRLRDVTAGRALFLVNGSADVALEAAADGVHLPETAEPPPTTWTYTWGRSVHSSAAAARALSEGARYLIAGLVFQTRSHPGTAPAGLSLIREIAAFAQVPVIGIGGITADNTRDVMQAGAQGVAVISAILASDDPRQAAARLHEALRLAVV